MKNLSHLLDIAKAGYSYPDMAVEANVAQKQAPSPSFKNTKKMMATAFRGNTKPAPLPKSAAAPAFDMDTFNRENPIIEGKEGAELPSTTKRMAKPSKKMDADSQASKMKSTTKKAYQILPSGKASGSSSPNPKPFVRKTRKPDADSQAMRMKSTQKGIFSDVSPHEQMKAKREERASRSVLDPAKMGFADAAVHLNSGKLKNRAWHPPSVVQQKHDPSVKKEFHHHFRQVARNNSPMALPKSFVIPSNEGMIGKGAVHNPAALAAYIGREKYGDEEYAKMSAEGKHHKKKTNKPGGGKRFARLEGKLEHKKSYRAGKLAKAGIGYIEKHYSGKNCAKCHDPLTEDNADIHSATYGERHHRGPLCKGCCAKMRD
jgi:hypothetical protein